MAAAIVPIISTILPTAIPLVVRLIDKLFPPKTGEAKLNVVTDIVTAIQNGLAAAGVGAPTTPDQTKSVVQAVVNQLDSAGQLKGAATQIPSNPSISGIPVADLLIALGNVLKAA